MTKTKDHDAVLFMGGRVLSTLGSTLSATALSAIAVTHFHASAGQVGVIAAAGSVPPLLFGLLAGVLADRVRRPRRLLVLADLACACCMTAVALGMWRSLADYRWLVGLNLALGTVSVVMESVYFIHLRTVVTGELAPARARLQVGQTSAQVAGSAVSGPLFAAIGGVAHLAVDAVTYLASASSLLLLRRSHPVGRKEPENARASSPARAGAARRFLHEARTSTRVLSATPVLRALMTFLLVQGTCSVAAGTLVAPYLLGSLGLPVAAYSVPLTVRALLAVGGSLLAARLVGRRVDEARLMAGGLIGGSVSTAMMPLAQGHGVAALVVASVSLGSAALSGAVTNIALASALTRWVPEESMGRAAGAYQFLGTAGIVVGALAGGLLGDLLGVRGGLTVCAVALLLSLTLAIPVARAATRPPVTAAHPGVPEPGAAESEVSPAGGRVSRRPGPLPGGTCPECGEPGVRRGPSAHPALLYLLCDTDGCGWRSDLLC
ncbi:MFS transporter [Streptomyces sp. NPDC046860]|uniref:MFS transporter n=1 Tax=Streptomyces sp. NPDC046860 TaxID=3154495 RepID=UPI0034113A32